MISKHIALYSILLAMQISPCLFAQLSSFEVKREQNKDGTIPGIKDLNNLRKIGKPQEQIIQGVPVQINKIEPDYVYIPKLEQEVSEIDQYSINGKPFCYLIRMICVRYYEGKRYHFLCETRQAYYDDQGNGLFTTREGIGPAPDPKLHIPYPVRLPDWTKKEDPESK